MDQETAFVFLGLSRGASQDEITKAYRELAQIYHPDKQAGQNLNVQDVQTQRPKVASRDHKTRQENDGDVNPLDEYKRKPRTVNALDEYKRKRMQTTFFDRLFTAIIMILGSGSLWGLQLPFQC